MSKNASIASERKIKPANSELFNLYTNQERKAWLKKRQVETNEAPQLFTSKTEFGLSAKIQDSDSILETIHAALFELSSNNLDSCLKKLQRLQGFKKYNETTLSKEYKLCFLRYELELIEDQILSGSALLQNKVAFAEFLTKINAIEQNQIINFAKLQSAEKNPATVEFKSQILTQEEQQELIGKGITLSAQQCNLLFQIEHLLLADASRSKVRGFLDTGFGKTFLAEKLGKYQEILARRKEQQDGPASKIAKSKIVNIDLANQDLLQRQSDADLSNTIYVIDEFTFFTPDNQKRLRGLVDRGAKIIRFGASENYFKLTEDVRRAEAKNTETSEVKKSNSQDGGATVEQKRKELASLRTELASVDQSTNDEGTKKKEIQELEQAKKNLQIQLSKYTGIFCDSEVSYETDDKTTAAKNALKTPENVIINFGKLRNAANEKTTDEKSSVKSLHKKISGMSSLLGNFYSKQKFEGQKKKTPNWTEKDVVVVDKEIQDAAKEVLSTIDFIENKLAEITTELSKKTSATKSSSPPRDSAKIQQEIEACKKSIISLKQQDSQGSGSITATKLEQKKLDLQAAKERRKVTIEKIEQANVAEFEGDKNSWVELLKTNDDKEKKRTQHIFPGISLDYTTDLQQSNLHNQLKDALNATKKNLIIVNIISKNGSNEDEHFCLIARKFKNQKNIEDVAFTKTKVGNLHWYREISDHTKFQNPDSITLLEGIDKKLTKEELAELTLNIGVNEAKKAYSSETAITGRIDFSKNYKMPISENAIMVYAGKNYEGVVGGDYGELSILNSEADSQNIYLTNKADVNVDLIKQMRGRRRNDEEYSSFKTNIFVKKDILTSETEGDLAKKLSNLAQANTSSQDLDKMISGLENKISKYYKDFNELKNLLRTTGEDDKGRIEKKEQTIIGKIILGDLAEFATLQDLLKRGSSSTEINPKFIRDLRLLTFYQSLKDNSLKDLGCLNFIKNNRGDFVISDAELETLESSLDQSQKTPEQLEALSLLLPNIKRTKEGQEKNINSSKEKEREIAEWRSSEAAANEATINAEASRKAAKNLQPHINVINASLDQIQELIKLANETAETYEKKAAENQSKENILRDKQKVLEEEEKTKQLVTALEDQLLKTKLDDLATAKKNFIILLESVLGGLKDAKEGEERLGKLKNLLTKYKSQNSSGAPREIGADSLEFKQDCEILHDSLKYFHNSANSSKPVNKNATFGVQSSGSRLSSRPISYDQNPKNVEPTTPDDSPNTTNIKIIDANDNVNASNASITLKIGRKELDIIETTTLPIQETIKTPQTERTELSTEEQKEGELPQSDEKNNAAKTVAQNLVTEAIDPSILKKAAKSFVSNVFEEYFEKSKKPTSTKEGGLLSKGDKENNATSEQNLVTKVINTDIKDPSAEAIASKIVQNTEDVKPGKNTLLQNQATVPQNSVVQNGNVLEKTDEAAEQNSTTNAAADQKSQNFNGQSNGVELKDLGPSTTGDDSLDTNGANNQGDKNATIDASAAVNPTISTHVAPYQTSKDVGGQGNGVATTSEYAKKEGPASNQADSSVYTTNSVTTVMTAAVSGVTKTLYTTTTTENENQNINGNFAVKIEETSKTPGTEEQTPTTSETSPDNVIKTIKTNNLPEAIHTNLSIKKTEEEIINNDIKLINPPQNQTRQAAAKYESDTIDTEENIYKAIDKDTINNATQSFVKNITMQVIEKSTPKDHNDNTLGNAANDEVKRVNNTVAQTNVLEENDGVAGGITGAVKAKDIKKFVTESHKTAALFSGDSTTPLSEEHIKNQVQVNEEMLNWYKWEKQNATPSQSVKTPSAQQLADNLYKPLELSDGSIWKRTDRGNNLRVMQGIYGQDGNSDSEQKQVEEVLELIIIDSAKQAGLTRTETIAAIEAAYKKGGNSHSYNVETQKYSDDPLRDQSEEARKQRIFGGAFQERTKSLGILTSRLGSDKGLRSTFIPKYVFEKFKSETNEDDAKLCALSQDQANLLNEFKSKVEGKLAPSKSK